MPASAVGEVDMEVDHSFPDLPPFPSDSEVPTAPLLRLSLQRLLDGEEAEIARLWEASRELGFFYLDLRGAGDIPMGDNVPSNGIATNGTPSTGINGDLVLSTPIPTPINGDAFLATAAHLFTASDAIFDLPVSEKQKFDYAAQGSYFGYKGYGSATIGAGGRKDRNEFFNIAKDDVLEQAQSLAYPAVLDQFRPELKKFMTTSHAIACLILNRLDTCLGLREGTLASLHRLSAISGDQVRWVSAEPQPEQDRKTALGAHTDFGSVTVLFNRLGGLQVLQPGVEYASLDAVDEKHWLYVRPLPGHCIVNLGDAMVKFTSGLLRSNVHRVVNPPGDQQTWKRTSLVYFARPTDEVLLAPIEGSKVVDEQREKLKRQGIDEQVEVITSKDWILRRALGPRGYGDIRKAGGTEVTSARAVAAQ